MGKSFLLFALFLSVSQGVYSQAKLKQQFRDAREPGENDYVKLKSGEKREIKDIDFPAYTAKGKIVFADGDKVKFNEDDVLECQTADGFYKYMKYHASIPFRGFISGDGLATRQTKGPINVYRFVARYPYRENGVNTYGQEVLYFMEQGNDGKLFMLANDTNQVNRVAAMVAKSKLAMQAITELRSSYGKLKNLGTTIDKMIEAAELYDKDAAQGKLEN